MTVVKSQSFCGGQNGLTVLAKINFKCVENIFDHLVRPFWPIYFWKVFEFFVATMVNGSCHAAVKVRRLSNYTSHDSLN